MKSGYLILAAPLAPLSVSAEDVQYRGHTLEVDASQEARPVGRMVGTQYSINASAARIVEKAQGCLATLRGATVQPVDPAAGQVVATLDVDYSSMFSSRAVRSQLAVQAGEGRFQLVHSGLAHVQAGEDDAQQPSLTPISEGGGGDKALDALIETETRIVDCLYK